MVIRKRKLAISFTMVALAALLILLPLATSCATTPAAQKGTLKYAEGGWDTHQFETRIAAFITEHGYGYQSEFIPGETITMLQGTRRGDMDIDIEAGIAQMPEVFNEAIDSGDVVKLSLSLPDMWQGWLVPTYMIKGDPARGIKATAPDLKSVFDMPKYWELFKDPEDPSKGRFYSCIPGWQCQEINEAKIKAYGLDKTYNVFLPGSDAALSSSMVAAYEKGKPWFGYYWTPTWVLAKLDMTPLEEPAWEKSKWNADAKVWETAYPVLDNYVLVTDDLVNRAPEVVEFLNHFGITIDHANKALLYMQETGSKPADAALWFLKNYESVWTQWVPSDVAKRVKDALLSE